MDIQKQKLTIEGAVTYSRLFDALKGMYEVDDDDSVWEIFNQADDQIEEVVNALKLLSAPPAPVVVKVDENGNPDGFISWYERKFSGQTYKGSSHVSDCDEAYRAGVKAAGGSVADE